MSKNYSGSIALTKLKSAIVEMKGKSGLVKGVFIPINANYLTVVEKDGQTSVYLNINVAVHDQPDKYDQSGFIGHRSDSKQYKDASEEEKAEMKKLPILGNFKSFEPKSNDSIDSKPLTENDDLPF